MSKRNFWIAVGIPLVFLAFVLATGAVLFGKYAMLPEASSMMGDVEAAPPNAVTSSGTAFNMMGGVAVGAPSAPEKGVLSPNPGPIPPVPEPTAGVTAADVQARIIKTGYLDLTVKDVNEAAGKIGAYAEGKGGFVQNTSVSEREDGTKYGTVDIRVPAKEFEGAMNEIKTYAVVVNTDTTSGQDVTEQYTDLQSQLTNAQAQEAQYLDILKKAVTVEEILQVQPYLDQVQSTINSLKGQIQYMDNVTSYSTISVSLTEEATVRAPTKEFRPSDAVTAAIQALVATAQSLAIVAIWLVVLGGPIALVLLLLAWIGTKILLKLMRK